MAPGHHAAGFANDLGRRREDGGDRFDWHALGEGSDVEGEQHTPAHREDVTACVGGGDGAEVGGVVDERREEVGGRHHCCLVVEAVHSGVVERGQAHEQAGRGCPRQRLHQAIERRGTPFGSAAPARRPLREAQG